MNKEKIIKCLIASGISIAALLVITLLVTVPYLMSITVTLLIFGIIVRAVYFLVDDATDGKWFGLFRDKEGDDA